MLEQVGQLEVGADAYCERLASGHVLIAGPELEHALLLDPTLGRVERLPRGVDTIHVGAGIHAETDLDGGLRIVDRHDNELVNVEVRGDRAGVRFDASGGVLWELALRRRWEIRARLARHGRLVGELELPEPHPALRAWSLAAVRPVADGIVVASVDRHVAIELGPAGLLVHELGFDAFVDWMPGGRALLAASGGGWLTIHRWPTGTVVRRLSTARMAELLADQVGFHGRVIDDDRAIIDTDRGRLLLIDLVEPGAEVIELRLDGDARNLGLSCLELGRTGRLLTGRQGAAHVKIWDGSAAVRTIPARGLR